MKKRLLSLLLTDALCLSLLPVSALAEEPGAADSEVVETSIGADIKDNGDIGSNAESPDSTEEPEGGKPTVQEAQTSTAVQSAENVAEVTIGGTATQYTDIREAFAAAQKAESAAVKLLTDVTISPNDYGDHYGIDLKSGNITLDLNGCTIQTTGGASRFIQRNAVFYIEGGEDSSSRLTVRNSSSSTGKIVQPNGGQAIHVGYEGTLTVQSGVTIEVTSDAEYGTSSYVTTQNCAVFLTGGGTADVQGGTLTGKKGIYVKNGTLTVSGDSKISGKSSYALLVAEDAVTENNSTVTLSGGTYTGAEPYSIWNADGTAASLLAKGYRFESEGSESGYSDDNHGVAGNTAVAERPANEFSYVDASGKEQTQANCAALTTDGFQGALAGGTTWFAANTSFTADNPLQVLGTVNLILCDGVTVTLNKGIALNGNYTQPATLNIYAQSGGTGKLICIGKSGYGGAGIYDNSLSDDYETTLNIYGGIITATGADFPSPDSSLYGAGIGTKANDQSKSTMTVNISGGTVTAKSGGAGAQAIGNGTDAKGTVTVNIAPGMKCVRTDDLNTVCAPGNVDGTSVTVTKCENHKWGYKDNGETHTQTCTLCNADGGSEAHSPAAYVSVNDSQHNVVCVCGKTIATEDHAMQCTPNADGLTHRTKCKYCDLTSVDQPHTFQDGACTACQIRKAAEYNGQQYASLQAAIDAAAADGGTVTLAQDVAENVTVTGGTVTVDLNGNRWSASISEAADHWGRIPLTVTGGSVTLKNGTLDQGHTTSQGSYGIRIQGGRVTVKGDAVVIGTTTGREDGSCYPAIRLESGDLTLETGATLVHGLEVPSGKTLSDYLAPGTAFRRYSYDESAGTCTVNNGYVPDVYTKNVYSIPNMALVVVAHPAHTFTQNEDGMYVCDCGFSCAHKNIPETGENAGLCENCDTQFSAKVTDANGKVTYYADENGVHGVARALQNAPDDSTIKALTSGRYDVTITGGKTLTLDMNGTTNNGGSITLGVLEGKNTPADTGNTLILTGNGKFVSYVGVQTVYSTLTLFPENTLIVDEHWNGDLGQVRLYLAYGASREAKAQLSGGTFQSIGPQSWDAASTTAGSWLAEGYAFRHTDGEKAWVRYDTELTTESATAKNPLENVEVVKCTTHIDSNGDGKCDYCNRPVSDFTASVTTTSNETTYYENLFDAFTAAKSGNTVTLLQDIELSQSLNTSNYASGIILDLNSKKLSGDLDPIIIVQGDLTIRDSSGTNSGSIVSTSGRVMYMYSGTLTIQGGTFNTSGSKTLESQAGTVNIEDGVWNSELTMLCTTVIKGGTFNGLVVIHKACTISGGTFSGINAVGRAVGTLLADGCGFKTTGENGSWLTSDALSKTTAVNVTAVKAPIKFTITVTPDTTVEYGQPVDLEVKYDWQASEAESVKNEWYSVAENGTTGEKIAAATWCTVTPTVGTHTYRLIVTANGYTVSRDVTITINRRDLSNATVVPSVPVYNGQPRTPTVSQVSIFIDYHTSLYLVEKRGDYTVDVTPQTDAGTYDLTIKGKGNYTGEKTVSWNIFPREVTNPTVTLEYSSHVYTGEELQPTVTVKDSETVIPENEYTVSYENNTNAGTAAVTVTNKAGGNYTLGAASMSFQITKADAAVTAAPKANTLTYNGTEQPLVTAGTPSGGTMYYSLAENGEYAASIPTGKNAASYTVWYKVVGDGNHNDTAPQSVNVTIGKAPVTVTAQDKTAYTGDAVPDLSAPVRDTDYTVSGLFGADTLEGAVTLTYDGTPDLTKAGSTAIQISGTLANDNYTVAYVNGALTVTNRPSSGGGGGGGGSSSGSATTKTETTTNSDGSVTKTETKPDGTVIQTTTAKDGSTTRTETKPDGSSITQRTTADGSTGTVKTDANGNTQAEAKLSDKAVKAGKKSGEAVPVPAEVRAGENSNSAPTVKVELPKDAGETKIEIPVENVSSGAVAVIVHEDGTEELVKDSLPTETGVQLTVEGTTTVKILDHSKDFADTKGHWAKDAIDFVSARGLVSGVSGTTYAPDAPATRAQLWTILARWNNADLTGGATWYEKDQTWSKTNGISDGANPNGVITRAQMVTMLWRTAGSPENKTPGSFTDVAANSYYTQAVAWAVEHGITSGVGSGRFDPNAACTRAQIAAFLMRCYQSK